MRHENRGIVVELELDWVGCQFFSFSIWLNFAFRLTSRWLVMSGILNCTSSVVRSRPLARYLLNSYAHHITVPRQQRIYQVHRCRCARGFLTSYP